MSDVLTRGSRLAGAIFAAIAFSLSGCRPVVQLTIEPSAVEWIAMKTGAPWAGARIVLFAARDAEKIGQIVRLMNSAANKREATRWERHEIWRGHGGGPALLTVKLKDVEFIWLRTMTHTTSKIQPDGAELVTGTAYRDRVQMIVGSDTESKVYTVLSEELAEYVLEGWEADLPPVEEFSITPRTSRLGEMVSISGDGSTEKEIDIYLSERYGNSQSNERYLIGKVPVEYGAWRWEGAIADRAITTFDGRQVILKKDSYWFEVQTGSGRSGGGTFDPTFVTRTID